MYINVTAFKIKHHNDRFNFKRKIPRKGEKKMRINLKRKLGIIGMVGILLCSSVTVSAATNKTDLTVTQSKYIPKITQQGQLPLCGFFAASYAYSYEANKLTNSNTEYAPYSLATKKKTTAMGTYGLQEPIDSLEDMGLLTKAAYPLSFSDESKVTLSNLPWFNASTSMQGTIDALNIRISDSKINSVGTDYAGAIKNIKSYIDQGKMVLVTSHSPQIINTNVITGKTQYATNNTTDRNKTAIVRFNNTSGHAMVIVGYDNNMWVDVNGNEEIDTGEVGAFKFANSWGTGFGDSGYIWVLYDAFYPQSKIEGVGTIGKNNISAVSQYGVIYVEKKEPLLIFKGNYVAEMDDTNHSLNIKSDKYTRLNYNIFTQATPLTTMADVSSAIVNSNNTLTCNVTLSSQINECNNSSVSMNGIAFLDSENNVVKSFSSVFKNPTTGQSPFDDCYYKTANYSVTLLLGDVNYDGTIDMDDANLALKFSLLIEDSSYLQKKLGDVNKDGVLNNSDVQLILNHALGIISSF